MRFWLICHGVLDESCHRWEFEVRRWLSGCQVERIDCAKQDSLFLSEIEYHPVTDNNGSVPSKTESIINNVPLLTQGWYYHQNTGYVASRLMTVQHRKNLLQALTGHSKEEKASQMRGEFTLSGWDYSTTELFLLTDIYATYPVYYYEAPSGAFYAANDIRLLLLFDEIPFEINYQACRLCLTYNMAIGESELPDGATFFKHIYKLPSASILTYKNRQIKISQYWGINSLTNFSSQLTLKESTQMFEQYFTQSVKERISNHLTGLTFSGGIDSSTILAIAIKEGWEHRIISINHSYRDSELQKAGDKHLVERAYNKNNLKGFIVYGDEDLKISNIQKGRDRLEFIDGPHPLANIAGNEMTAAITHQLGLRNVLTGEAGDALLGGGIGLVHSLCLDKKMRHSLLALLHFARPDFLKLLLLVWRFGISPFIPRYSNFFYYRYLWEDNHAEKPPNFFTSTQSIFFEKILSQSKSEWKKSQQLNDWGKRYTYDFLWPRARYFHALTTYVPPSHPFLDKQIIELIFQIPFYHHYDYKNEYKGFYHGSKMLSRKLFGHIMPELIAKREKKTSYALMTRKQYANDHVQLLKLFNPQNKPLTSELGLIDNKKFYEHLLATVLLVQDSNCDLGVLFQYVRAVVDLEIWLQEMQVTRQQLLQRTAPQPYRLPNDFETFGNVFL